MQISCRAKFRRLPLRVRPAGVVSFTMKVTRTPSAKIVLHETGLGTPSPETVRERAVELARIDGRAQYNDQDWERAKIEVHGGHPMLLGHNGESEMIESVSERDMMVVDHGRHVQNVQIDEAENAIEELIAEGLDEAVHDQMLAAARVMELEAVEEM